MTRYKVHVARTRKVETEVEGVISIEANSLGEAEHEALWITPRSQGKYVSTWNGATKNDRETVVIKGIEEEEETHG